MTVPSVDPHLTEEIVSALVRINSVNPDVAPGAPGEAEVVGYLEGLFARFGIETAVVPAAPHRPSIVATVPGSGGGRSLMFNAHVDTVGVDGMAAPFSGENHNGRIYGRGAYDMKGAMAACAAAAITVHQWETTLAGDVVVTGVADEEYASLGMSSVLDRVRTDGAIVTEPTHLKLCRAHKGFVWVRVETKGRAAHGSRFEDGVDANMRMGRFLAELSGLEQRIRSGRRHPLLGPGSLHAAVLAGGSGISTYADRCGLDIERRTIPGETGEQVAQEIQDIIEGLRRVDPDLEITQETTLVREPFEVSAQSDVVRAVAAALTTLGRTPEHIGDGPWMDSALLASAGIDTVVIGPSGAGAHAAEEWVEIQSVVDLANILVRSAVEYCR